MFPSVAFLPRRSKWFGSGISCRCKSFSRTAEGSFVPTVGIHTNSLCAAPTNSLFQEAALSRTCSDGKRQQRQQHLKPYTKIESRWLRLEYETNSRRPAPGSRATEGRERKVIGKQFLPRSFLWVVELEKQFYFMESTSPPSIREDLARRFWEGSQKEAYGSLYHPFVVALAGGTLPISAFQKYIAQDFYFLAAFAEAYGLASENADGEEAKAALQQLKQGVQFELDQVHLSLVETPEPLTSIQPNPATSAYTEFLLGIARGDNSNLLQVNEVGGNEFIAAQRKRRIAAYTIAAMTPCNRLYAFLGLEIKKAFPNGDTGSSPYAQWIDTYASSEFGSIVAQCEQLLHRLAIPFPGEIDVGAMERLYRKAMELELEFFAAQQQAPDSLPVPFPLFQSSLGYNPQFILISDFDSTCTVSDSCPALADLSVASLERKMREGRHVISSSSAEELRSRWDTLVEKYSQDYAQLLDRLLPAKEVSSGDLQQKDRAYNPEAARHVLESIAEFEITANGRVVDSGVLSGLSVGDVKEAGGSIPLRDGCNALLKRISGESSNIDCHILSVCWSRTFIEGSFLANGLQINEIQSNELQFTNEGISTGNILRRVQTALDKEKCFIDIVNRTEKHLEEKERSKRAFTVYVGDSLTDLLCLLRADIGIVVGESSSLRRVAETTGITLLPLYTALAQQVVCLSRDGAEARSWTKQDGVLYRVSNWHELHAFLLGS